ncbi:MAG: hypothetical protein ACKVQC_04985 [Elusimicrobiota bacterium]
MSHIETPSNPADSLPSDSPKVVTPLMQQYLSVKLKYPDEILFFRLGDFYEMFYEDAQRAAPILEVALTARQAVPMCGIPHHAATSYISKLLKAGLSVAMAEQLEDPKKTKGMVKRDVVRVITPGTIVEDELLPGKANNFLVSIAVLKGEKGQVRWALAAADVSTGRQWVLEEPSDMAFNSLKSHLVSLAPSEVLLLGEAASFISPILDKKAVVRFEPVPAQTPRLIEQALAGIKNYLARDNASALASLQSPEVLPSESTGILFLDETAVRHLELVASSDPLHSSPTLLSVIDRTVTSLGSRLIRWWLLHPSRKRDVIEDRLNQVEELIESPSMREELRQTLKEVADIERICVRVQGGSASPRDLASLRMSISRFPQIQKILQRATSQGGAQYFQKNILALQIPQELSALLENQLTDEPPAKLSDGGVIRD